MPRASGKTKLPKIRRQYFSIFGLDGGLDYSQPTTAIGNNMSPGCSEMTYRRKVMSKTTGTQYFSDTNTTPLDGSVMHIDQYYKMSGSDKLVVHTTTNTYTYNSDNDFLECITRGVVVENCEDAWTANANVTSAVDTDPRKGTNSVKNTIASGFTTGVASYENFASVDLTGYTHLHFYIKSSIALVAGDLGIRLSEENAGGIGATYADYNVPALVAGVWQEVSVALTSPDNDNGGTYPDDLNAVLSVSLLANEDKGAQVVHIDDVMCTIENTGDEDDVITSEIMNDYYISNNGVAPIEFWDMSAATMAILAGCTTLAAKKIGKFGERLVLFHVIDNGTPKPRRVQWTVAGGITIPPNATDWSGTGSGNTDLESTMGVDFIKNAEKLGNYYIIYGERTLVLMDYTGRVSAPFSFYTRVTGIGLPAERAIVNLGNEHIFLGWEDVYAYRGGKEVISVGHRIKDELFAVMDPAYIGRCFMVFIEERNEIRLFYTPVGSTTPSKYFVLNLDNNSWSRGSRSYTGFGYFNVVTATTWDTIGDDADTTWDELPLSMRWDDDVLASLSPLTLYGDSSGKIQKDNLATHNLVGAAIDGWHETKDFVVGERYRETLTNWMELNFEARGNTVDISYSTNQGVTWSTSVAFTLTSAWAQYNYDFGINSDMVRFKFRNNTSGETFEVRHLELGFVPASDRGM